MKLTPAFSYYNPSVSSHAATIFDFCGAGNLACSRLSGGAVGQDSILLAGLQPVCCC
jgi:hypothetical protein